MKAKRTKKNDLGLHKVRAIFRFRAWVIHALFEDKFVFCTSFTFFEALPISLTLLYRRPNHNRSLPFRNCLMKGKLLGLKSRRLSIRERRITFQFVFWMTNEKQRIDPNDLVDEILCTHCNANVMAQMFTTDPLPITLHWVKMLQSSKWVDLKILGVISVALPDWLCPRRSD